MGAIELARQALQLQIPDGVQLGKIRLRDGDAEVELELTTGIGPAPVDGPDPEEVIPRALRPFASDLGLMGVDRDA